MALMRVVLPEPFGPMSARISPSSTRRSTRESAQRPPKFSVTPSISRSAIGLPALGRPLPPVGGNHTAPGPLDDPVEAARREDEDAEDDERVDDQAIVLQE